MAYKQTLVGARQIVLRFSRNTSSAFAASKNIGVGGYLLLTIPVSTFCLGTWQVKRRTWKLNLIEDVNKQMQAPPVDLPDDLNELSNMEYRRVRIHGTFDHSKELYIGPRPLITNMEETSGGVMSARPKSGHLVITPFHITDRNITILVNRGWVPQNNKDPSTRAEGQIKDEIELTGVVRLPENRPQFSPKTQQNSNFFFYRDVPKMANMTGAAPIFIDADRSSSLPGGPIGGQTRVTFRNEHLSYIITWYSLSVATLFMWYKKVFKRTKILV